jgi:periplasmic protein CpxP/Spy
MLSPNPLPRIAVSRNKQPPRQSPSLTSLSLGPLGKLIAPTMNATNLQTIFVSTIAGILLLSPIAPQANAAPRHTQIAQGDRGQQRQADPARKAQWEAKRQDMKAKIDAILTPEQRQQLQSAVASGLPPHFAMAQLNLSPAQKQQLAAAFPKLAALNLTDAQKSQMLQVAQSSRQQVQSILNPTQQEQLRAAIAQGQNPKEAMKGLNLTDAQKTQLRQVRQSSKEALVALLTPEQRQQMGRYREGGEWGGKKGKGRGVAPNAMNQAPVR